MNEQRLTRQVEASNEIIHRALEHTMSFTTIHRPANVRSRNGPVKSITAGTGMTTCRLGLQRKR